MQIPWPLVQTSPAERYHLPDVVPSKNSRWSHPPWLIVLSGPSVPSGSGSHQCTRTSPQLSVRWLFNASPTTEGQQLSLLTPLSRWHPFCLRCALHTLTPRILPEEAIPPGRRSWEPPESKILSEQGNFPLPDEDGGCCLCPSRRKMQARSRHWQMLPLLSVRHPLWMVFLPAPLAARTGDVYVGCLSPGLWAS